MFFINVQKNIFFKEGNFLRLFPFKKPYFDPCKKLLHLSLYVLSSTELSTLKKEEMRVDIERLWSVVLMMTLMASMYEWCGKNAQHHKWNSDVNCGL